MTTIVSIAFEGESIRRMVKGRRLTFDGPVAIPNVGEQVANPMAGAPDEPLHGSVKSRLFLYSENEVSVTLILTPS